MVDPTDAGHNPEDYTGFTKAHLEAFSRFRDVAVDNHLGGGNLDGSGANPDVQHHIKGVVDQETLLNQYELPVVMSIPTSGSSTPRTTAADDTEFRFSVSAWVSDYDQATGWKRPRSSSGTSSITWNRTGTWNQPLVLGIPSLGMLAWMGQMRLVTISH